jgi:HSP90 family molecular chaperone
MAKPKAASAQQAQLLFGSGFLHDHVGQIIDDPSIAIVELVANAYDAGAYKVNVQWPDLPGQSLSVTDNGTGMTRDEFDRRWRTLAYDRVAEQGSEVAFPPGVPKRKRTAFGHNGKGRFSAFCFADEYTVETWRDGSSTTAIVRKTNGGVIPFECAVQEEKHKIGHGTRISVVARKCLASVGNGESVLPLR